MGLSGLPEYLKANYANSVFEQALVSKNIFEFHLHGHQIARGSVAVNNIFEVTLSLDNGTESHFHKTAVKLMYPAQQREKIQPLIKTEKKVKALKLEPIISIKGRNFIKNKTLYVLMKEKQVVFITLLEGEIIRGLISDFSKYDLTVSLKGGRLVTVLRHAIHDIRDKKGRCYLKAIQQQTRDWQKSELFIEEKPSHDENFE